MKRIFKSIFLAAVICLSLQASQFVTISDTGVLNPDGTLFTGQVVVSWPDYFINGVEHQPGILEVPVASGVINVSLIANDQMVPHDTFYSVTYIQPGKPAFTAHWYLTTTSGTFTVAQIQTSVSGGGSGSIPNGIAGQFLHYSANGNAVAAYTLVASDIPQIAYSSLSGLPTLGSAAATSTSAYDPAGAATTAASAAQANAEAASLQKSNNLSDLPNPSAARGNLGLGTAATTASSAYDAAGAAAARAAASACTTGQYATGTGTTSTPCAQVQYSQIGGTAPATPPLLNSLSGTYGTTSGNNYYPAAADGYGVILGTHYEEVVYLPDGSSGTGSQVTLPAGWWVEVINASGSTMTLGTANPNGWIAYYATVSGQGSPTNPTINIPPGAHLIAEWIGSSGGPAKDNWMIIGYAEAQALATYH